MRPKDYFQLTRCRDIVCQRQILSQYGMPPTTPVEVAVRGISRATTFHKTIPGFPVDGSSRLAKAVVVSGSPLPAFNGVYSAVSCDGVYGFYQSNGTRLVDKGRLDRWHLEYKDGTVHAWSSTWYNSGLPTGKREWRYISGQDGLPLLDGGAHHGPWIAFDLTVTALPLLTAQFHQQMKQADDCMRQWARVLGGEYTYTEHGNDKASEALAAFMRKYVGLRRMLGRVLLLYYSPLTTDSLE